MSTPFPFETFRLEKNSGEYKDFGSSNSEYPLKGVTYPVDYGDIENYVGEDGANLDIFMGDSGELCGFIKVYRPELADGEHKFYVNLTEAEESKVLSEFKPVLLDSGRYASTDELMLAIEPFKK